MLAKVLSSAVLGIDAYLVEVEVDIAMGLLLQRNCIPYQDNLLPPMTPDTPTWTPGRCAENVPHPEGGSDHVE